MIQFKDVTKKFGENKVLDEVSFELDKGEFAFIVGPSGAGKTTLLRLLIKELKADEGDILIDGKNLNKYSKPQIRQAVGAAFQDFKILEDRTVFENIAIALEIEGYKRKEIKKKVNEIISLVDLEEKEKLFPIELSGGELQRAVLARAAVSDPKILFADEPTENLDPETAWQVISVLKKINKEKETTVITATHDTEIVDSLEERVITLKKGKIIDDQEKGKYRKL
jgi:cell division transport system ATP-binding protein